MKRSDFLPLVTLAVLLISGCTPEPHDPHRAAQQDVDLPIMCKAGPDCTEKWRKAEEWVTQNAVYNIPVQSDTVIQTEQPHGLDSRPGFKVTKTLDNADIYSIRFEVTCNNWFGCTPSVHGAKTDFANFVTGPSANPANLKLGIRVNPVSAAIARANGMLDTNGAVAIVKVAPASIADKTGLKTGDIILLFDGKSVTTENELQERVADTLPNQVVRLLIARGKEQQTLKARL